LSLHSALEIIAYGAWNGGKKVDNSIFENRGMFFKGNIPVKRETIEERIGVRTRFIAPHNERISTIALNDLIEKSSIDPSMIKVVIGATNIGEDKNDPGPLIRYPFELIRERCPHALVFDLYAGCPGFNVSVELLFMLSMSGFLKKGDVSVIVGAEKINHSNAFKPLDTANIIFGDDAMATALETKISARPMGRYFKSEKARFSFKGDFIAGIAKKIFNLNGNSRIDGIIMDNQLGRFLYKVPATAARIQHGLVELMYPEEAAKGTFKRFRDAMEFYNKNVNSFGFDIMTLEDDPGIVERIARSYVESGKFKCIASVYLKRDLTGEVTLHRGEGFVFERPRYGIVDVLTKTHGCFADYIDTVEIDGDVFARMNGRGVFLYATHGAREHLNEILSRNNLKIDDIDLFVAHQDNFAMIPMTLEKVLHGDDPLITKKAVSDYLANRMITNIHERGNCSVVCMQRLPYDLQRGALKEDTIQGYPVNRNLENLRSAKIILNDSMGTGMTRSSMLQKLP